MKKQLQLPTLKYTGNELKKMTLHLFLQIVGKIRLKMTPRKNHWWYITEYVNTKGISAGPIPFAEGTAQFEIILNIIHHQLEIITSSGQHESFPLTDGLTVAEFYKKLMAILKKLQIEVSIVNRPYDLEIDSAFSEITHFHHYDPTYTHDLWQILIWVDHVFKDFSGRFYGKTCPVHLYWHSMDLAVTRFSGKEAPAMSADARLSDKDAYSHECISFGFWAGDKNMPEPAFYSYTYPSPEGLDQEPLQPSDAQWIVSNGSPMAILTYRELLKAEQSKTVLLNFLESAYLAGAKRAHWDIKKLKVPELNEL